MLFFSRAADLIEVELTGAEPEQTLEQINLQGVHVFRVLTSGELTRRFLIRRKDYAFLKTHCERRGNRLRILRKNGGYWLIKGLINRPLFLVGLLLLGIIALYLPTRILFVRVEGNSSIPNRRIIAAAEDCGIRIGASRREVRSEKMKNALLSAIPELKWAGVNTSGCVAIISVREGSEKESEYTDKQVTSIVADRDGYILSGTTTQGNRLFQIGQSVKKGQILISGYTDCGFCIRATQAQGEIFAQTNHTFDVIMPSETAVRHNIRDVKRKYSLLFRKKRINLWKDSGISEGSCGRMYEEYYVTLPGGFQLPIALCVETFVYYLEAKTLVSEKDAEVSLKEFAQQYLLQKMIAGEIVTGVQNVSLEKGIYRLQGEYVCREMIGREVTEQIGEANGKNN